MGPTHDERTRRVAQAIARGGPPPGEPFPCPYLPGRAARHVTLLPSPLTPGVYHSLMDLNFRRLGPVFYQPRCDGCRECRAIRIPVEEFRATRAQRRCQARNADLAVAIGPPQPSEEKLQLYRRYLASRHDGQMDGSLLEFRSFLYTTVVETVELVFRAGDRLLGAAIADLEPRAISAVYCYFEPAEGERRGLGVYNVLRLLQECRSSGREWLYLGYYVRDSAKMNYKARFRPHELLGDDGTWSRGS